MTKRQLDHLVATINALLFRPRSYYNNPGKRMNDKGIYASLRSVSVNEGKSSRIVELSVGVPKHITPDWNKLILITYSFGQNPAYVHLSSRRKRGYAKFEVMNDTYAKVAAPA